MASTSCEYSYCFDDDSISDPPGVLCPMNSFTTSELVTEKLNNYEDTSTITVIVTSVKQANGEVHSLYQFVAEDLEETPESVEEDDHRLTSIRLTNDFLYEDIQKKFADTSVERLSPDSAKLWNRECPMFIVAWAVYEDNDGCIHIRIQPPSSPPLLETPLKSDLSFIHPERNDVFVRMHKPNSPPMLEHGLGTGRQGKQTQVKKRAKSEPNMEPVLMKATEEKHNEAIQFLRSQHDFSTNHEDLFTAVIFTQKEGGDDFGVKVLFFRGFLYNKDDRIFKFNWAFSLLAFHSSKLRRFVETLNPNSPSRLGPVAYDLSALRNLFECPVEDSSNGCELRCLSKDKSLKKYEVTNTNLSVEVRRQKVSFYVNETEKFYCTWFEKREECDPNSVKFVLRDELEKNVKERLLRDAAPYAKETQEAGEMVVISSFHSVDTKVEQDALVAERHLYVLVGVGNQDNISLPEHFQYHDAKYSVVVQTWFASDKVMAKCISCLWPNEHQQSTIAKHKWLYTQLGSSVIDIKCLELDFKMSCNKLDVRMPKKLKNIHPLEFWAHEARGHVMNLGEGDGNRTSAEFPTIQVKIRKMGPNFPNHIGAEKTPARKRKITSDNEEGLVSDNKKQKLGDISDDEVDHIPSSHNLSLVTPQTLPPSKNYGSGKDDLPKQSPKLDNPEPHNSNRQDERTSRVDTIDKNHDLLNLRDNNAHIKFVNA